MVYGLDSAKGWFRTIRETRLRSEERSRKSNEVVDLHPYDFQL